MKLLEVCELGKSLIDRVTLSSGAHGHTPPPDLAEPCEMCVMELRWQLGALCRWEGFDPDYRSDLPEGDSRVIGRFLQVCNDRWINRGWIAEAEALKEFAVADLSRKSDDVELKRMFRSADWAVR